AFLASKHDRMTQMRYSEPLPSLDVPLHRESVRIIDVLSVQWRENLAAFSKENGLGWDNQDLEFIRHLYQEVLKRNATDVELFQLGQLNSNHCRHWDWHGVWT